MARQHTMTPARRRALRKAQAISARKRRGKGKGKLAAANRQLDKRRKSRGGGVGRTGKYIAAAGVIAGAAYIGKKHYQIDFATINSRASQGGKSSQGMYGKGGRKHVWAARRVGGRYTGGILSFGKQRAVRHTSGSTRRRGAPKTNSNRVVSARAKFRYGLTRRSFGYRR